MKEVLCAIALGSNLGDSLAILEGALVCLNQIPGISLQSRASIYLTAPVYLTTPIDLPQPDYLNCCALLKTHLSPEELLRILLKIEADFGRIRRERWGPRLLDLDLLLFDNLVLETPTLQIPHPRMHERAFVLAPLAEIAPDWIEPISGKPIAKLLQAVDCSGVQRLPN